MISAFRRPASLSAALAVWSLVTAACEKVPLLAPTGSTIMLTAGASALPVGGATTLTAQVVEQAGTAPHEGTLVVFTTTLGSVAPAQAQTDINGRVTVQFNAGSASGTATVTAGSGAAKAATAATATTVGSDTVRIAIGAAAVGGVSITANPSTVPASGGSSTIIATVVDAAGNLLAGVPVTFTTDHGAVSPALVNTNASGSAPSTLVTSATAKVTATAGVPSTGTTPTIPSASVTVSVNVTSSVAAGTPVPASPTVGQAVSIPLTYSTASGASPIARVIVDWGDGSVQTFSGQPGGVSHAYGVAGSFLVRITGVDAFGDTSQTSAAVTVGPKPLPTVALSASPNPATVNATVTFTITSGLPSGVTNDFIQDVRIDFGDGTVFDLGAQTGSGTSAISVPHIYASSETFIATATVTDTNGSQAKASTPVIVK
jgi:adhesin/invasin